MDHHARLSSNQNSAFEKDTLAVVHPTSPFCFVRDVGPSRSLSLPNDDGSCCVSTSNSGYSVLLLSAFDDKISWSTISIFVRHRRWGVGGSLPSNLCVVGVWLFISHIPTHHRHYRTTTGKKTVVDLWFSLTSSSSSSSTHPFIVFLGGDWHHSFLFPYRSSLHYYTLHHHGKLLRWLSALGPFSILFWSDLIWSDPISIDRLKEWFLHSA